MTSRTAPLGRVATTQAIGSFVDGIVLSTAVLYFSTHVGFPEATIGLGLTLAAASALVLLVPLGVLADRIGLRVSAVVACVAVAGALALYATAATPAGYIAAAIAFVVTQAFLGAVRQAIVSSAAREADRVRNRAILHTLLNGGMGLGTVVGAVLTAVDVVALFPAAYLLGGAAALGCAVLFVSLPREARAGAGAAEPSVAAARRPGLVALRDRRFVTVTALFAIVQLTMPVLSVILPLWIVTRTDAPVWVAPVALGLNTAVVLVTQTGWAGRVRDAGAASRSLGLAAVALLVAGALLGLTGLALGAVATSTLVLVAILSLTVGEVAAGAGTWQVAFRELPAGAHGQYQAVFALSGSVARMLGPALALPLVLLLGGPGWALLGLALAAAAAALALLARR